MKLTCLAFLITITILSSAFAKVDFQMDDAVVHSVSTTDEKIVLIVSGKCRFLLRKDSTDSPAWVESYLDHGVIEVLRRGAPGAGYTSWEEHGKQAKALEGAKAKIQTLEGRYVIERGQIIFQSCEIATFQASEGPTR
jgi:hypothetical protein